jgi:hypothetical protein
MIESQIQLRNPSPHHEVTRVLPIKGFEHTYWRRPTEDEKKYHRYSPNENIEDTMTVEGWALLKWPFVPDPQDAAHLKILSIELGPVMVTQSKFRNRLFVDSSDPHRLAEHLGFTTALMEFGDTESSG